MNLFSIPIVAIAISIVIAWALFAILCSLIHEAIVQIKAERGRFMHFYLLKQLQDLTNEINWGNALYQQGNVSLLSRDIRKPSDDIDPAVFANTIIAAVGNSHILQSKLQSLGAEHKNSTEIKSEDTKYEGASPASSGLEAIVYNNRLLYNFKAAVSYLKPSEQISLFISALEHAEAQSALTGGTINEQQVYQHLVENLQNWFTELTQRLTLWYKKKTRRRLFWLGLLLAIVLNVDSVQLFTIFKANPDTRNKVIDFYQKNAGYLNGIANQLDSGMTLKKNDTIMVHSNMYTDTAKLKKQVDSLLRQRKINDNQLIHNIDSLHAMAKTYTTKVDSLIKSADLPIGIQYNIINNPCNIISWEFLLKLIGFLISGFAASFGAPFWFELLKKVYSTTKPS